MLTNTIVACILNKNVAVAQNGVIQKNLMASAPVRNPGVSHHYLDLTGSNTTVNQHTGLSSSSNKMQTTALETCTKLSTFCNNGDFESGLDESQYQLSKCSGR